MKNFLKRILAFALVLVMVAGYVPTSVFAAEEAPALPTATVTELNKADLTFAMNFKVDEVSDEQMAYYGDWYADFELTSNKPVTFNSNGGKDGYLAGQYDAWSENWVNVPPSDATLEANVPLKIMEYAAAMLGQSGLKLTYADVYNGVQDFNCGVFFEPAFLLANPDLEVTLELRMYNPENEAESYVIGTTYKFTVPTTPELPTATVTELSKADLTFAMNFLVDEPNAMQLAYYGGWYADFELTSNKPVTFNANGGKDGYLSGQYDAWSENWVNVPPSDATLNADEPLKIMEYAAAMLGQSGLKLTYADVYNGVQNFDCGVFFEPAFLEANPDLEVTLELRIYNDQNEEESYTIGTPYVFTLSAAPELPTATVTEVENDKLTFAMNFKADEATAAQLAYYGGWYADFELKVNKPVTFDANGTGDGWLSGQYDAWSENWVNVPFKAPVSLAANEVVKIMATAAAQMGKPGLKYTYQEVYDVVKDFDCGVFFTPEFLAANPDLEVTLELRAYNPADETESYKIGDTYVFTLPAVPALPTATITEVENDKLTFAMNFKADEATAEQLAYYGEWFADFELKVNKPVTFDANGTGDGWLSGQYDAWSENWVNVPFKAPVSLAANEIVKIMATAAEQMGKPGLKYTYQEVYDVVKDFDCGVFFEPAFLIANPDLEVTLELRIYNPADETENYKIGDTYVFTLPAVPELPTATTTDVANEDLIFAMNFKADEATAEQLAYYGKWFADFELKVNKPVTFDANGTGDGWLSGQYDAWSENWVNVPFKAPVSLAANEVVKIMATAAEQMGKPGLKYTYQEVYDVVKDFDCGVFFEPEFLAANPDLVVTLELRMYNPYDESISYKIGDTYVFANEYVAYNVQTGKLYSKVSTATMEAQAGETVRLLKDTEDMIVNILNDVTLDLDGHYLETFYMCSFGHIIDGSEENTGRLETQNILINPANAQLPIMQNGAYGFYEIKKAAAAVLTKTQNGIEVPDGGVVYCFQFQFEDLARELLKSGQDATKVNIAVRATWTRTDGTTAIQHFVYTDELVNGVLNSYNPETGKMGKMYTLTLNSVAEFPNLTCQACVVNADKVEYSVAPSAAAAANSQAVNLTDDNASAVVPQGALINGKAEDLALQVSDLERTSSNITVSAGEELKAVDVHVSGIASGNKVPVIVTVNQMVAAGLNSGNLALYHVENGTTVTMTQVATLEEVNAHNEFYYDPATGDVTMALASFSEVTAVSEPDAAWEGKFDYSWYKSDSDFFEIANADQLAAFGAIVGGMNGQTQDSFDGKTVKLIADINLGNNIFYPIGYTNSTGSYTKVSGGEVSSTLNFFEGTFDGNGHTVANFTQNTWGMFGDYNDGYSGTPNHYDDGMGLFGYVLNGTVKNLTVDNFKSEGEFTPTGVITAYAANSTFENIAITKCNPGVYNTGNGGIIGIAGNYDDDGSKEIKLTNITVDNSNTITALWGSWDVACGGLVGMFRGNATGGKITFTNCHVAAQIDVYNDVCANYQYYAYRYSGMLIGSVRHNTTDENGRTVPLTEGISTKNCTVNYGDWNNYFYCEFEKNTMASYSEDYQFSRVPHSELNFTDTNGNGIVDTDEVSSVIGCTHEHTAAEDKQAVYRPFYQLFTGYGWGVNSAGIDEYPGITASVGEYTESAKKFNSTGKTEFVAGETYTIGQLFADAKNVPVAGVDVEVFVSPVVDANGVATSDVSGKYVANDTWTEGTLTFSGSGAATITITDYYFCTPTTITVNVVEETPDVAVVDRLGQYKLVTDANKIKEGGQYIIVAFVDGNYYALGKDDTADFINRVEIEVGSDIKDVAYEWTIAADGDGVVLKDGSNYLYYSGSTDLAIDSSETVWTLTNVSTKEDVTIGEGAFWLISGGRGVAYRKGNNTDKFRAYSIQNATNNNTGAYFFDLYFYEKVTCEHANTEPVDAVEATCTESGIEEGTTQCTACDAYVTGGEIAPLGHNFNDATCTAPKTCSVCGATEGTALSHNWNNATCTAPKTCSVCDATEGEALGHTWKDATCTAPKTCSACGTTEGAAAGHTWSDATCTAPKTCSACGTTEGEALAHNYVDGVCSNCGTKDPNQAVKYTVIFAVPEGITAPEARTVNSGEEITLPATGVVEGYTFVGWVAEEVVAETTSAPANIYAADKNYTVNGDTTFYALFTRTEGAAASGNTYIKYSGVLTEGDYVIVYNNYAMEAAVDSGRLSYTNVTVSNNQIASPAADIVWHIAPSGDYWTIYNAAQAKYAAGTGAKNKAQLLASGTDNKSLWSVTGSATYEFVNKANKTAGVNSNLRNNGTFGFACYSTSTGGALTLYKKVDATTPTTYYTTNPMIGESGGETGGETQNPALEITVSDFSTKSYDDNNKTWTKDGYSYTSYQVMQQSNAMQWQKSKGYITIASNDFTKLELKVTAGTFTVTVDGTTVDGTTSDGVTTYDLTGKTGEIKISVGSATGKVDYLKFYK